MPHIHGTSFMLVHIAVILVLFCLLNQLHLEEARKMSPLGCRASLGKSQDVLHCGAPVKARHGRQRR